MDRYFNQKFAVSIFPNFYFCFLVSQLVSNIPTTIERWARHVEDIFVLFLNGHDHDDYLMLLYMLSDY